jgi:magnesium-transporting ATPase (P-type)
MASVGLKTLTLAYKQIPIDDFQNLLNQYHIESDEFRESIQSPLVYLGTFGLDDPVREDVGKSIELIKYGCMIADSVGKKSGIKN